MRLFLYFLHSSKKKIELWCTCRRNTVYRYTLCIIKLRSESHAQNTSTSHCLKIYPVTTQSFIWPSYICFSYNKYKIMVHFDERTPSDQGTLSHNGRVLSSPCKRTFNEGTPGIYFLWDVEYRFNCN